MALRPSRPPPKPVEPQPRRRLSRVEFAHLMLEQKGRCKDCGERLKADQIIDEHRNPLYNGGSNDLENRALLCTGCAGEKTLDYNAAWIHGRRVRGEIGQKRRRELRRLKPRSQRRTFPTNRDGPFKRKMNGWVVRRPKRRRRVRRVRSHLNLASNR